METKAIDRKVAIKFKQLRKEVGLSQEEISNLLKIPRTAYSAVEDCKRELSVGEFDKLCRVYRISPNEILGWMRTKPLTESDKNGN